MLSDMETALRRTNQKQTDSLPASRVVRSEAALRKVLLRYAAAAGTC